jgi:hypothetical protein
MTTPNPRNRIGYQSRTLRGVLIAALLGLGSPPPMTALAANTVYFSATDAGQTKSISQWGVEVAWVSSDNMH